MARPRKRGLSYFPHDCDASADDKIAALTSLFGNDGYAFYFRLLERIYSTEDGEFQLKNCNALQRGENSAIIALVTADRLRVTPEKLEMMVLASLDLGIFDREAYETRGVLTSNGIKARLSGVGLRRENQRERTERFREQNNYNALQPRTITPEKEKEKEKEIEDKKRKPPKGGARKFASLSPFPENQNPGAENPKQTPIEPEPAKSPTIDEQQNTTETTNKGQFVQPDANAGIKRGKSGFDARTIEIPSQLDNPEVKKAWLVWCAHREEIKKPITRQSAEQTINKFVNLSAARFVAAIEHTVANGWQGLREPEPEKNNGKKTVLETRNESRRMFGLPELNQAEHNDFLQRLIGKTSQATTLDITPKRRRLPQ